MKELLPRLTAKYILSVCVLATLAIATNSVAQLKVLHITPRAQENDTWCWAASAQMILDAMPNDREAPAGQCDYVSSTVGSNCCSDGFRFNPFSTPLPYDPISGCNDGDALDYSTYHYGFRYTSDAALTFETLWRSIGMNQPVEFSWFWDYGGCPSYRAGSHMMVIYGAFHTRIPEMPSLLLVYDPWTLRYPLQWSKYYRYHSGTRLIDGGTVIPYDYYVSGPNHRIHRRDRYAFQSRGPIETAEPTEIQRIDIPDCTPLCCDQPAIPFGKEDYLKAQKFANIFIHKFLPMALHDTLSRRVNLPNSLSHGSWHIGNGWNNFYLSMPSFFNMSDSAIASQHLGPAISLTFPIIVGTEVTSSISVYLDSTDMLWKVSYIGEAPRAIAIATLRDTLAAHFPTTDIQVVQIPAFDLEFLVDATQASGFTLFGSYDNPRVGYTRGIATPLKTVRDRERQIHS